MPPQPKGGGRRPRLPSIRNPSRSPSVRSSPAPQGSPQPSVQDAQPKKKQNIWQCSYCEPSKSNVVEQDGSLVCIECGTVFSESIMANEVTFGEAASGAALVQGTTIQEGQRHTHIPGLGFNNSRVDKDQSLQNSVRVGKEEITRLINALGVPGVLDQAVNYYSLARIHAFQRPVRENAAIAVYTACRDSNQNTVLLIDLAELIRVNVYDLGATYKKFIQRIDLVNPGDVDKSNSQRLIEIEPLLLKFAKRLEFGTSLKKVANDAASILARMSRDWMVTGRQPMGLCGACLILAARMNNFRRTLREVVYVVRAGEMTIMKRLNEFSNTHAARLTVDGFRDWKSNDTLAEALPPSLKPPPKKKRKVLQLEDDDSDGTSIRQSSLAPSEISESLIEPELRRDKDGFLIPKLPSLRSTRSHAGVSLDGIAEDDEVEEIESPRRKRGRPKKQPLPEVNPTEEDFAAEAILEREIEANLETIQEDKTILEERGPGWFEAKVLADSIRAQERKASSRDHHARFDTMSEQIDEEEFEDDPEVMHCLLDKREVEVKERIWVTHNHDWLRQQQEKILREQLDEARGKKKRTGPRKKMARRGDGSVLGSSPALSAADASSKMLKKRATRVAFSKNVNYEQLQDIYGRDTWEEDEGSPSKRGSSESASVASRENSTSPLATRKSPGTPASDHGDDDNPTAGSPTKAGASRDAPVEIEDDVSSEDEEVQEEEEAVGREMTPDFGDELPTFEAEEEEVEDDDEDEDILGAAQNYGVDTGGATY